VLHAGRVRGACEARLAASQYAALSFIVLVPIVWALLLIPRMGVKRAVKRAGREARREARRA